MNFAEAFEKSDWALKPTYVMDLPDARTDLDGVITKGDWHSAMEHLDAEKPCLLFIEGRFIRKIRLRTAGFPSIPRPGLVPMVAEGHLERALTNQSGELVEAIILPDDVEGAC